MANKGTWKISIGGSSFADYTDICEPEGESGGPNILEIPGYGAAAPLFLNLGNSRIPRRYLLTRQHATDTAAHAFYKTAVATWSGVATAVLTHIDYSGTETTYTITGAKVELEMLEIFGYTTVSRITITGGAAT